MSRDKWVITWGEFKKIVESQGVTDDLKISYIDMNGEHDPKVDIGNFKSNIIGIDYEKRCTITDGEDRTADDVDQELRECRDRKRN